MPAAHLGERSRRGGLLAPHEAAILAGDVRLVLCADLDGEPDEQVLTEALAHLVECYPLLAGRFVTRGDRPVVQVDDDRPAAVVVCAATSSTRSSTPR